MLKVKIIGHVGLIEVADLISSNEMVWTCRSPITAVRNEGVLSLRILIVILGSLSLEQHLFEPADLPLVGKYLRV
jgi:hypothetical protein